MDKFHLSKFEMLDIGGIPSGVPYGRDIDLIKGLFIGEILGEYTGSHELFSSWVFNRDVRHLGEYSKGYAEMVWRIKSMIPMLSTDEIVGEILHQLLEEESKFIEAWVGT